jgi:hypothetical protein
MEDKKEAADKPKSGLLDSFMRGLGLRNTAIGMPGFGFGAGGAPAQVGSVPPPPEGMRYTPKDLRTVVSPVQWPRPRTPGCHSA